jgi:holliday junction DNA helicase RuvB
MDLFKNKLTALFHDSISNVSRKSDRIFFDDIIGYDHIKRLFQIALHCSEPVSILLSGPPASAKTLFLQCLTRLQNSYFIDGSNCSRAGIVDYIFAHKPRYLLVDELDKLSAKDQTFLLNLIETAIVSETKYKKTRSMKIETSAFATSNNVENIIRPLQSRFFIVKLEPYGYEQFYKITTRLLTSKYNVDEEIAEAIANVVWNRIKSTNIRDCIRIGRMAKSIDDVYWIANTFLSEIS